jgi:hypothetical protein
MSQMSVVGCLRAARKGRNAPQRIFFGSTFVHAELFEPGDEDVGGVASSFFGLA